MHVHLQRSSVIHALFADIKSRLECCFFQQRFSRNLESYIGFSDIYMAPFLYAKISGGAIINCHSNNNDPNTIAVSDDSDDAFHGAVITGGVINHKSPASGTPTGIARPGRYLFQSRKYNDQQRISLQVRRQRALAAAVTALRETIATAAGQPNENNESQSSPDPPQHHETQASKPSDDSNAGKGVEVNSAQLYILASQFAELYARDMVQRDAIIYALTQR